VLVRDAPPQPTGDTPSRRSVAAEDSARDRRWAPLARWRVPPFASGQPCRSARRRCLDRAGAPPAAWHALGAAAAHPQRRQVARRRAVSAPATVLARPARLCRPRKRSWPDPLRRRQESPAKRHHATAPVQGSKRWERNVLPGQGTRGPSWHTPSASHASNSALCRDQITADRQAHRAAALLYKARERWAQDFEFIYLTWGGATGIRTPDLLHAISRQHVHRSTSAQVTVPGSARPSRQVRTGCCTFLLYRPARPVRLPMSA
jgi:hypothetical protein